MLFRSVEHGADVNAFRHTRRATALMVAAHEDDLESIQLLLDYGADTTIKDKNGKTALDWAHDEETKALLQAVIVPTEEPEAETVEEQAEEQAEEP